MNKKKSIFVVLLLVLLVFLLMYSFVEFSRFDYSNSNTLFEEHERFNNTEITFQAKIIEREPNNQTIVAGIESYPYTVVKINISIVDVSLKKDDVVFVVGILRGEKTVFAEKILVRGLWEEDLIYFLSVPAIPFVLYLFFRTWRFNRKTFMFEWRRKDA
jgi:hypothetical protein